MTGGNWGDIDPVRAAANASAPARHKRFYERVDVIALDGGHGIALDGMATRTPGKRRLVVPDRSIAVTMAAEWRSQRAFIEPDTMPVTRLANSALDGVAGNRAAVAAETARYADSDLLCYRAAGPGPLVARQTTAWDPVIAWVETRFGVRPNFALGVMHVSQPAVLVTAVRDALASRSDFALAGLNLATILTGSIFIALAADAGELSEETAWSAAHVDEDWQTSQWGEDAEAMARRAERRRAFDAAVLFFKTDGAGR